MMVATLSPPPNVRVLARDSLFATQPSKPFPARRTTSRRMAERSSRFERMTGTSSS
jgi:hypothetical protein